MKFKTFTLTIFGPFETLNDDDVENGEDVCLAVLFCKSYSLPFESELQGERACCTITLYVSLRPDWSLEFSITDCDSSARNMKT